MGITNYPLLTRCLTGLGQCELVTHRHCLFLHGVWDMGKAEHCCQIHCDDNICKLVHFKISGHEEDDDMPLDAQSLNAEDKVDRKWKIKENLIDPLLEHEKVGL